MTATSDLATRTQTAIDPANVPGWGVDADPRNDPTYPYREREKDDHSGVWERPPQQETTTEVLQSIEHVRRPAVVGTSTPPAGLSGIIRRFAFQWSESNLVHWMLLLAADRINVAEGVLADTRHGKIPNVAAEMGGRAEWKHNKQGLAVKIAVGAAVLGLGALLFSRRGQEG